MGLPIPSMPAMPNMNFGLDVKNLKLGWPGYLTFGKGGAAKASSGPSVGPADLAAIVEGPPNLVPPETSETAPNAGRMDTLDVDTASLLEAISTESVGSYTRAASPSPSTLSKSLQLGDIVPNVSPSNASPVEPQEGESDGVHLTVPGIAYLPPLDTTPVATFLQTPVHLANTEDPLKTQRKRVYHLTVRSGKQINVIVGLSVV